MWQYLSRRAIFSGPVNRFQNFCPAEPKNPTVNFCPIVCIGTWCADEPEAESWGQAHGYEASHTICPACQAKVLNGLG